MGNYGTGTNWSPYNIDDDNSTIIGSSRRTTRTSLEIDNDEQEEDEGSVIGSVIGSVVSGLASNTVLQPNFVQDQQNIIITMHGKEEGMNRNSKKNDDDRSRVSTSQSELEYLQGIFPHVNKKEDIAALYENTHSDISTNTVSTQHFLNQMQANHPALITGMPPTLTHNALTHNDMYAASINTSPKYNSNDNDFNNQNNNIQQQKYRKRNTDNIPKYNGYQYESQDRKIIIEHNQRRKSSSKENEHDNNSIDSNRIITGPKNDINNTNNNNNNMDKKIKTKKRKNKKRKKKKKKGEGEYIALGSSPTRITVTSQSYDSNMNKGGGGGCFCDCLTSIFYTIIAVVSVCLIFGSLIVDGLIAYNVYWPQDGYFKSIYFTPCVMAIGLTLISYSLNSACFFIHTDYCSCFGCIAPMCRCAMSLPPFGVVYTLMLIPGVHSLPFHMASALFQYALNLVFMMTRYSRNTLSDISIWNWIQLGVGSTHLILSPMFAWLQQSNQANMTVYRCLKLIMLWLCSIAPLTVLELINIFPVFIEKFTYNNLDIRTFITLIAWSCLIRLIFAFIFVDEDGSRLSLICFKRLRVYDGDNNNNNKGGNNNNNNNNNKKKKKKKKKKKPQRPTCWMCIYSLRGFGQLILQIFYLALPLLPTAAATVRLYKKQCIEYAKWNHLCVSVYLIFTYLPMLYLLLGSEEPGEYTISTIAIAYGCTVWVVLFLPIYLKKWVTFRW